VTSWDRLAVLAVAAIMGGLVADAATAEMSPGFRQFLAVYRCDVVHRLEQIYATGDPASTRDRYIAITVPEHPHGYVQCMFYDHQTKLLCEASSGFYFMKSGEPRFHQPPQTIATLAQLGFSTDDSAGNFRTDFDLTALPDFNAMADFILRTLFDGYGARPETNLKFNVPFAPRMPSTCIPVS
jgi:hypothetical protein